MRLNLNTQLSVVEKIHLYNVHVRVPRRCALPHHSMTSSFRFECRHDQHLSCRSQHYQQTAVYSCAFSSVPRPVECVIATTRPVGMRRSLLSGLSPSEFRIWIRFVTIFPDRQELSLRSKAVKKGTYARTKNLSFISKPGLLSVK